MDKTEFAALADYLEELGHGAILIPEDKHKAIVQALRDAAAALAPKAD